MNTDHYYLLIKIWIGFGILLFPVLLSITAPYGRHSRKDWGPVIPNRVGWIIMELPALVMFIVFFMVGPNPVGFVSLIFFILYTIHYTNRAIVFPLRTHTSEKFMPLIIAVFAIFFNLVNGFINGHYFGSISGGYGVEWLYDIRFITGGFLFLLGMAINLKSDNQLLALRRTVQNGYSIPTGGLFRYVSCPNFFGEILEWTGFAIMTWSPAALAFAVWTLVNLIPRAIDHHRWYREKFSDYPPERKAVIPFII
jgi:protein-S-isoprenylcysteine O-methyltransferase Ste14